VRGIAHGQTGDRRNAEPASRNSRDLYVRLQQSSTVLDPTEPRQITTAADLWDVCEGSGQLSSDPVNGREQDGDRQVLSSAHPWC